MPVTSPEVLGLACEIADTLTLVAPRGWKNATIALDNRGGQLRVVSVDAKLEQTPGPKPELGMDPAARLGGMSAAFTELMHTLHGEGVDWSGTRATVTRTPGAQLVVTLLNEDGRPASSVSVPREYLDSLFLTEPFLDALAEAAPGFDSAQAALGARVAGCSRWTYAQPERKLIFEFPDRPKLELPAQILGTWSKDDESWLWGWANTSIDPGCTDQVERALQPDHHAPGWAVFWREKYPCEDEFAANVALLAGAKMKATAVYRGRSGTTWAYFAVMG